jgi:pSer/pThr/pTyr-binding forkhead associated (FHA) protein
MATLCLLDDVGLIAKRWELNNEPVSIGRDDSAEVSLDDESLSRLHFMVFRDKDGYAIQDLDSQNGTWVDGKRTHTTKLKHHDCIVAGRTIFLFDERTLPARSIPVTTQSNQSARITAQPAG